MRRVALVLILAVACSDPAAPAADAALDGASGVDAAPHDAAVQLDAGPPPCPLDAIPRAATITAGGRVELPADLDGDTITVTAPAGWLAARTGTTTSVRAPYGVTGTFDVAVARQCAGGAASAMIAVSVAPLTWIALPAWRDGVDGPSAREHPIVFIDETAPDRLMLYGGYAFRPRQFTIVHDLWAYDLAQDRWTAWTSSAAPERAGGRAAVIPGTASLLYFGGADATFSARLILDRLDLDAARNHGTWTRQPLVRGVGAHGSELGSVVLDAPRNRLVSACGYDNGDVHCQVTAYDLAQQTYDVLEPAAGDQPSPRYGFFTAHDRENQRLVLFSGAQAPDGANPVNPAGDTWALELDEDPVRWVRLIETSSVAVPGRRNGCSAFDAEGQRLFVWGGTPDAMTTVQGLFAIDLIAGHERVTRVEITPPKPARSSCIGVYDGARRRILFGFGNNSSAIFADWVALEL